MSVKGILSNAVFYGILACALVLTAKTGYAYYERLQRGPTQPAATVPEWRAYAATGNRIGSEHPALTLVEFSDYQCPVCLRMDTELRDLQRKHPNQLAIVVRQFPLSIHPFAPAAAIAAECAAAQGRFPEYHRALFDQQKRLAQKPWASLAVDAGVPDTAAFSRCLSSPAPAALVQADTIAGDKLGVYGTPTVLIGADEFVGIPWDFSALVERRLAQAAARG